MSNFKFAMFCNVIIEAIYVVCVTKAAMYFENAALLWWYLLVLLLGYAVKSTPEDEGN